LHYNVLSKASGDAMSKILTKATQHTTGTDSAGV